MLGHNKRHAEGSLGSLGPYFDSAGTEGSSLTSTVKSLATNTAQIRSIPLCTIHILDPKDCCLGLTQKGKQANVRRDMMHIL